MEEQANALEASDPGLLSLEQPAEDRGFASGKGMERVHTKCQQVSESKTETHTKVRHSGILKHGYKECEFAREEILTVYE